MRAVGGRRDEYRPVTSRLTQNGCPIALAKSCLGLGYPSLYLADLDAIAGAAPNWHVIEALAALGTELWIDAGVNDGVGLLALAGRTYIERPIKIIAGLESLPDIGLLEGMALQVGADRLIFSLDLFQGSPLWNGRGSGAFERSEPGVALAGPVQNAEEQMLLQQAMAIVEQAVRCDVRQIMVLDLARVGCGEGAGNLDLLRAIRQRWPAIKLISGGGVRSRADLQTFAAAGCQSVLVGSALHDGSL